MNAMDIFAVAFGIFVLAAYAWMFLLIATFDWHEKKLEQIKRLFKKEKRPARNRTVVRRTAKRTSPTRTVRRRTA